MFDIFQGQLINRIECLNCEYKSMAFDNFLDLSLSISRKAMKYTGYIDLEECLSDYIKPERMESNGYKCERCKKEVNL